MKVTYNESSNHIYNKKIVQFVVTLQIFLNSDEAYRNSNVKPVSLQVTLYRKLDCL